jgi:hypothetical protein
MLKRRSFVLAPALLLSVLNVSALEPAPTNWVPLLDAKLTHWELWMGVTHQTVQGRPDFWTHTIPADFPTADKTSARPYKSGMAK